MKRFDDSLITPIYVKTGDDEPWPEDGVFYMLSGSGLFLCRNHDFFQSCVPAGRAPTELAEQQSFHRIRYPKVPRRLLERVVGFFDCVWSVHGGEAVAALAWNQVQRKVEIVVPDQHTIVSRNGWGDAFPIGVKYQMPTDLPPHLRVFGDIHSHCGMDAYTSQVDADDETARSGLHIVVGRLNREPPQFHVEAVVDGTRFHVSPKLVMGTYVRRDWKFPKSWLERVSSNGGRNSYGSSKPNDTVATQYDSGKGDVEPEIDSEIDERQDEDEKRGKDDNSETSCANEEFEKHHDDPRSKGDHDADSTDSHNSAVNRHEINSPKDDSEKPGEPSAPSMTAESPSTESTHETPTDKTSESVDAQGSSEAAGMGDSLDRDNASGSNESAPSTIPDHTPPKLRMQPGSTDEKDHEHHEQQ